MTILFISLGGLIGVLGRFYSEVFLKKHLVIPYPVMIINIIGCALAGIVYYFIQKHEMPPHTYGFLVIGFLGGFTTFSTYALDILKLSLHGEGYLKLLSLAIASPAFGLLSCVAGYQLTKIILK